MNCQFLIIVRLNMVYIKTMNISDNMLLGKFMEKDVCIVIKKEELFLVISEKTNKLTLQLLIFKKD